MSAPTHFDVHPSVVLKLGEELIADEFTAIVEAAKNSYDAGATSIRIRIDTENPPDERFHSKYPSAKGTILIADDGEGMDADVLSAGWLIISYSRKRDLKRQWSAGHRPHRRVPLGDKGIGRLGLQRLGQNVEVFTSTGNGRGHHVSFTWKDFETASSLSEVPVTIEEWKGRQRRGTEVLVSGLKSAALWRGQQGRDRLQSKLSQMVSPFNELRECEVQATLNGTALDLAQFTRRVLEVAEQHYSFSFDGKQLSIRGEYTSDYVRIAVEGRPAVMDAIERDDGRALLRFLCAKGGAVAGDLSLIHKPGPRIVATRIIDLESLGELALSDRAPVSPGPFSGEIFHFDRRDRATGFERANDFKGFLDTQRGIRIYRNGFAFGRYGVDGGDWLGLGEGWSGGLGWYGLKPANTLGYIKLSAADNPQLEEKSDREGLTDSPAAANFIRLLREVIRYANSVNNHLRRGVLEFTKDLGVAEAGELVLDMDTAAVRLGNARTAAHRVKGAILRPESGTATTIDDVEELDKALSLGQALSAELERQRLEVRAMMDLAGLGLTAEALSHEIANVADQLAQRVKALGPALARSTTDPRVHEFIEHVRAAVGALRKQLAHLAPTLRFARERRERFDIRDFVAEQEAYFRERLAAKGIQLRVDAGDRGLPLRTSRGKLTQVVDNLVLNSEYWVSEQIRRTGTARGWIALRVRGTHLLVSDSGPGIDQSIEGMLFQPFVTLKPKGRGLGLFIVRQLLDSLGCSVALKADRNSHGRRFTFDLDLSGAVVDESEDDK